MLASNPIRPIRVLVAAVVVAICIGVGPVRASGGNEYPVPIKYLSFFSPTHSEYPGTDIFAKCGTVVVAPVTGTVSGLRRSDLWSQRTDNPWHRGGKFVSIIGIDGVRYYLSHLEKIVDKLTVGGFVQVGMGIGTVGRTGRAGACHVHFGISPPCTNPEWWVRRGVISPYSYLVHWQSDTEKSPAPEVLRWLSSNPVACLDPHQLSK